MSILLNLKSAATAMFGPTFRSSLIADMTAIESEVNNLDVVVSGLTANVTTDWVSGTIYAIGDHRRSPINFQTYRRITDGAGTTDPSADATNWVAVMAGNSSQKFDVAEATEATNAVPASQLQGGGLVSYTTGGSGTAFTITPAPALTAYTANQTFNLIFHAACGTAPTLQINGIATPPNLVRQLNDGSYQNLASNAFPAGWQSKVKLVSSTQALVLQIPSRKFTISGTRDVSLATGSVGYTGCGFKPRLVHMRSNISGTPAWSTGSYASGGGVQGCIYGNSGGTAANVGYDNTHLGVAFISPGNYVQIGWLSFDADGITLMFTKVGTPTGTDNFDLLLEE